MKVVLYNLIAFCLLVACTDTQTPKSKLDSSIYKSPEERVHVLKETIIAPSDFKDAEFELFNVNGFGDRAAGIPGASSWDYKFIVKTDPTNIPKWIDGSQPAVMKNDDYGWIRQLASKRPQNWVMTSVSRRYERQGVTVVVYFKEGIVCKRVLNL